jgi:hypothetical protein
MQQAGLTEALVSFARTLARGYDISDVLHDLVEHVTAVLGVTGAGVSLVEDSHLRFVTANREAVTALERAQESERQGPCIDALAAGRAVLVPRLVDRAATWPAYVARAQQVGIVSVASVPLTNASPIGALDLYDDRPHEWTEEELTATRIFADIATGYVLGASELQRERRTVEQLQQALDSRIVIEQAKGILSADEKITLDEAFARLRRHANNHNATLRSVAEAVVHLGLRP